MTKDPAAVSLGRKGGEARAAKLGPAERRAIATKASQAAARARTAKAQARKATLADPPAGTPPPPRTPTTATPQDRPTDSAANMT